jgi:hypothetical protein
VTRATLPPTFSTHFFFSHPRRKQQKKNQRFGRHFFFLEKTYLSDQIRRGKSKIAKGGKNAMTKVALLLVLLVAFACASEAFDLASFLGVARASVDDVGRGSVMQIIEEEKALTQDGAQGAAHALAFLNEAGLRNTIVVSVKDKTVAIFAAGADQACLNTVSRTLSIAYNGREDAFWGQELADEVWKSFVDLAQICARS